MMAQSLFILPCPDKLAFEILCFSSEEVIFLSLDLQRISIVYNIDVLILIQYLSVRGVKGLLGLSPLGLISRLLRGQVNLSI